MLFVSVPWWCGKCHHLQLMFVPKCVHNSFFSADRRSLRSCSAFCDILESSSFYGMRVVIAQFVPWFMFCWYFPCLLHQMPVMCVCVQNPITFKCCPFLNEEDEHLEELLATTFSSPLPCPFPWPLHPFTDTRECGLNESTAPPPLKCQKVAVEVSCSRNGPVLAN